MHLAVSSWSFRKPLDEGRMHLADVPQAVAALGIRRVELNDVFFWMPPPGLIGRLLGHKPQRTAPDYRRPVIRPIRQALIRAGVEVAALALTTNLAGTGSAAKAERDYMGTSLAVARELDASLLRVLTGGSQRPSALQLEGAAARLKTLVAAARTFNVRLAVENDGGMATDPDALAQLIELAGKDFVGVCLDLGNFPAETRLAGIRRLAPYAIHVHAKAREFGPDGEETQIDYRAALDALQEARYDKVISIEYEGDDDPVKGIQQTRALIERYWA